MEFYISQFITFLFILVRILAMIGFAPLLSHESVPTAVKIGISIFIAYILFTAHGSTQFVNVSGALTLGTLLVNVMKEILVGIMIGYGISMVFYGVRFGGYLIGADMGLTMANMFDPEFGDQVPVVGEFLYITTILLFILMDGQLFLIEALKTSFDVIPVASFNPFFSNNFLLHIIKLTGAVFIIAIKIAAPVTVAIFLTTVGLGILSRVVPQMQVFVISMGLNVGVGLFIFTACIPMYVFILKKLLTHFEGETFTLLQLMRP